MKTNNGIILPEPVKPGEDIYAKDFNVIIYALAKIIERLKKIQLVSSKDLAVSEHSTGTIANLRNSSNGGKEQTFPGLIITKTRPRYIAPPAASSSIKLYLTWGFVNALRPNNWATPIQIPGGGDSETHVAIKIYTPSVGVYTSCEWVQTTNRTDFTNPAWNANGGRPAHFYIFLGTVYRTDGEIYIQNEGSGSIHCYDYVTAIDSTGSDVASVYRYGVAYRRILH